MKRLLVFILLVFIVYNCSYSQDEEIEKISNRITVSKVNLIFKDHKSFEDNEITNIIKTGNTEFFSFDEYLIDIRRIEKFYFDNGFFDAFVDTITKAGTEEIEVAFIITENNSYKINKIFFNGLENLQPNVKKEIFAEELINIKSGNNYNKNSITNESNRVLKGLQNQGYAFATLQPPEIEKIESRIKDKKYSVNVYLIFNLGEQYYFGNTTKEIKNNTYNLNLDNIFYELEYKKGDLYSKDILIQSENRINRIAILENARILLKDIDTSKNSINFKISANIKNKYELQPEVLGYDISNSFFGGVGLSFSDRYFLCDSRTISAKARALANSLDNYRFEFILDLVQPHIFKNNKITGNWNLSTVLYSIDEFRITQIKNKFTFSYELPKYTYLNNIYLDWKISNDRIKFKLDVPLDSGQGVLHQPFISLFGSNVGITFVHSQLDNFQFPTKGNYQSYLFEESGLFNELAKKLFSVSTINYFKFSFVNKIFIPLTDRPDKNVLGSKFIIGNIFEYGDNGFTIIDDNGVTIPIGFVPLESKFIAGGSTSVRGWGARKLGTFEGRENGGNFIIEGNFEYRARPFLDKKGLFRDLGYVLFFDYGNLWDSYKKFKLSEMALAIGAGIRYYTIVGPVRFDLGFKLYDSFAPPSMDKWLFMNNFSTIFKDKLAIQFGIGNTF